MNNFSEWWILSKGADALMHIFAQFCGDLALIDFLLSIGSDFYQLCDLIDVSKCHRNLMYTNYLFILFSIPS